MVSSPDHTLPVICPPLAHHACLSHLILVVAFAELIPVCQCLSCAMEHKLDTVSRCAKQKGIRISLGLHMRSLLTECSIWKASLPRRAHCWHLFTTTTFITTPARLLPTSLRGFLSLICAACCLRVMSVDFSSLLRSFQMAALLSNTWAAPHSWVSQVKLLRTWVMVSVF